MNLKKFRTLNSESKPSFRLADSLIRNQTNFRRVSDNGFSRPPEDIPTDAFIRELVEEALTRSKEHITKEEDVTRKTYGNNEIKCWIFTEGKFGASFYIEDKYAWARESWIPKKTNFFLKFKKFFNGAREYTHGPHGYLHEEYEEKLEPTTPITHQDDPDFEPLNTQVKETYSSIEEVNWSDITNKMFSSPSLRGFDGSWAGNIGKYYVELAYWTAATQSPVPIKHLLGKFDSPFFEDYDVGDGSYLIFVIDPTSGKFESTWEYSTNDPEDLATNFEEEVPRMIENLDSGEGESFYDGAWSQYLDNNTNSLIFWKRVAKDYFSRTDDAYCIPWEGYVNGNYISVKLEIDPSKDDRLTVFVESNGKQYKQLLGRNDEAELIYKLVTKAISQ